MEKNNVGDEKGSLQELGQRIENARKLIVESENTKEVRVDAVRLSIELVSGVAVGSFLGFWVDKWLGSSPWFFIICFFFGVAAGMLNIYKLATKNDINNKQENS